MKLGQTKIQVGAVCCSFNAPSRWNLKHYAGASVGGAFALTAEARALATEGGTAVRAGGEGLGLLCLDASGVASAIEGMRGMD